MECRPEETASAIAFVDSESRWVWSVDDGAVIDAAGVRNQNRSPSKEIFVGQLSSAKLSTQSYGHVPGRCCADRYRAYFKSSFPWNLRAAAAKLSVCAIDNYMFRWYKEAAIRFVHLIFGAK
jgi:hypothetical protein